MRAASTLPLLLLASSVQATWWWGDKTSTSSICTTTTDKDSYEHHSKTKTDETAKTTKTKTDQDNKTTTDKHDTTTTTEKHQKTTTTDKYVAPTTTADCTICISATITATPIQETTPIKKTTTTPCTTTTVTPIQSSFYSTIPTYTPPIVATSTADPVYSVPAETTPIVSVPVETTPIPVETTTFKTTMPLIVPVTTATLITSASGKPTTTASGGLYGNGTASRTSTAVPVQFTAAAVNLPVVRWEGVGVVIVAVGFVSGLL